MPRADNGVTARLHLRVVPNASRDEILGWMDDGITCRVKLKALPVDGKANKALVRFVAAQLDLATAAVTLCAGERSRNKVVEVRGLSQAEIAARFETTASRSRQETAGNR